VFFRIVSGVVRGSCFWGVFMVLLGVVTFSVFCLRLLGVVCFVRFVSGVVRSSRLFVVVFLFVCVVCVCCFVCF